MRVAARKTNYQQVKDLVTNSQEPMMRSEIQAATGIQKQTVNIHLRTLNAEGLAHISGWELNRGRWAPLWAAGPGENVPEPAAGDDAMRNVMCAATALRTALRRARIQLPDTGHRTTFVGGINPWTGKVSGVQALPAECAEISRAQADSQREWDRYATQRSAYSTPPAKEF